jgi:uncharacterized ferredoxin-like protein
VGDEEQSPGALRVAIGPVVSMTALDTGMAIGIAMCIATGFGTAERVLLAIDPMVARGGVQRLLGRAT